MIKTICDRCRKETINDEIVKVKFERMRNNSIITIVELCEQCTNKTIKLIAGDVV